MSKADTQKPTSGTEQAGNAPTISAARPWLGSVSTRHRRCWPCSRRRIRVWLNSQLVSISLL